MKFWKFTMFCAGTTLGVLVLTAPAKAADANAVAFIKACPIQNRVANWDATSEGCRYTDDAGQWSVMWDNGSVIKLDTPQRTTPMTHNERAAEYRQQKRNAAQTMRRISNGS